jgi:hypothetical protein
LLVWKKLNESAGNSVPANVWEAAQHWYDHAGFGLGHATSESIESKKLATAKKAKAKKAGKK